MGPSPMVKYMKSTQVWHSKTGSWWWWVVVVVVVVVGGAGIPLSNFSRVRVGCGVGFRWGDFVGSACELHCEGRWKYPDNSPPPPLCNQSGQIPVKPTPSPLFSAAEDKQIVTHLTLMSMPHPVFLLAPPAPGTSHFQWAVKGFLSKPDMRLRI